MQDITSTPAQNLVTVGHIPCPTCRATGVAKVAYVTHDEYVSCPNCQATGVVEVKE